MNVFVRIRITIYMNERIRVQQQHQHDVPVCMMKRNMCYFNILPGTGLFIPN